MIINEAERAQPASNRFTVLVIGGNTVFLTDQTLGHKLHMGPCKPLSAPEFRQYVYFLEHDLTTLTIGEFFCKYGLRG